VSKVNLLVSVDDEHLDRFSEVVKGLEDAGMDVEQELEETGVITGSIDSEKVEQLRKVEGVSHVEESRQFQIAPPDSDIQ
jgi:UDP-N-acetylmuramate-alanine ligase